jgi:predicted lipid carrier protein YhbT
MRGGGGEVASEAKCDAAVRSLAARLDALDADTRAKHLLDRTVSCRVPDLGLTWTGRLCEEGLVDVTTDDDNRAQVRLTIASDDLVALVDGRLAVPTAVATGKIRIQASPFDLLRLSAFL